MDKNKFLKQHLNAAWLRPESALWDAIASEHISRHSIVNPSLDLGSGNGLFSFITAGGNFSIDYDWYRNVDPEGLWEQADIYDVCRINHLESFITERPQYRYSYALDHKSNLLNQAQALGFYEKVMAHDANQRLPFPDETFRTVFSNILYWLDDVKRSLGEIRRVLQKDGKAVLCVPNDKFFQYCFSYGWKESGDELLRLLNRGRSDCMHAVFSYQDFKTMAESECFIVDDHQYYLSPLTLKIWDIGMRPFSPALIRMILKLSDEDRRSFKSEWMETAEKFCVPLLEKEAQSRDEGGFHLFVLKKS